MTLRKAPISAHEAAGAADAAPPPSNRHFGLVVGAAAIAIGAFFHLTRGIGPVSTATLFAGGALVVLALAAPGLLTWPNRAWMRLGHWLGLIMTPIVMGVVYVTTFLPIGLIMKLKRIDPLKRARKSAGESYWIVRSPPGPDPATMPNQF